MKQARDEVVVLILSVEQSEETEYMKYYISQINRTVELDDELVRQHAELDILHEAPFVIAVITEYGHEPDQEEVSDEKLSEFCNQVLDSEIQALKALPYVAEFATRNEKMLREAAGRGVCIEESLEESMNSEDEYCVMDDTGKSVEMTDEMEKTLTEGMEHVKTKFPDLFEETVTIRLFNELDVKVSREDWRFMCQNRFFTDNPDEEVIQAEFVSGTGITENKKNLWGQASNRFTEYIEDLREIKLMDVNAMARNILSEEET